MSKSMNITSFDELRAHRAMFVIEAGWVKRWHTSRMLFDENVAAHSWGVATLIAMLHPDPSATLLRAALLHDVPEKLTGDITPWAKRSYPNLAMALGEAEADIEEKYGLFIGLTPDDKKWLGAADLFHAWLFIFHDVMYGNRTMFDDLEKATDKMDRMSVQGRMPVAFMQLRELLGKTYQP